jgi:hypothetical protein
MRKERPELVEIQLEPVYDGKKSNEFIVTVYNGTITTVKHVIGIESNFPVHVMQEGRVLNKNGIPSTFCETRAVSIPPASSSRFLFHWKDENSELKEIRLRASFMRAKTRWEGFI